MAKLTRPSRLLNLQKSPASNKVLTSTNATTSPLLRLPAEIRQRIWHYVLGGNILHVASSDRGEAPGVVVCNVCDDFDNRTSHPEARRMICRRRRCGSSGLYLVLDSHEQCYAQSGFSVDLLQTCRQIYHDTVLLPFTKNVFAVAAFDSSTKYTKFLNRLVPAQTRSISHLILQTRTIGICNRKLLARMRSLVTLQYVVLVRNYPYFGLKRMKFDWDRAMLEGLVELPHLDKVRIEVGIDSSSSVDNGLDMPQDLPSDEQAWIESVERKMLAIA